MTIFVLGSTGMLGQAVTREALLAGQDVIGVSRSSFIKWDFFESDFTSLALQLGVAEGDLLVNCVGWIPQKSSGSSEKDKNDAHALNIELVRQIHESQQLHEFSWIQIVTDCVFSGKAGGYFESSTPEPDDLYGLTKAAGENLMAGAMRIRCSIIGPDPINKSGLFEWFKNQNESSKVRGFENHIWNGVSTKAFGRLVSGLWREGGVRSGLHHWIPKDSVSKFELLRLFKEGLERADIEIEEHTSDKSVNRMLLTNNIGLNTDLWNVAGYQKIPSIAELVRELIIED